MSGGSGSGNATVTYRAAANPDAASRTGSLTVGGQSHTVTQTGLSSCTVDLNKYQDSFTVAGGSGTFDVAAPSTCAWVAASTVGWVRVTDPAGGAGTGSRRVTYAVDANPGAGSAQRDDRGRGQDVHDHTGRHHGVRLLRGTGRRPGVHERGIRSHRVGHHRRRLPVDLVDGASWITIASGLSGAGPGTISYTLGSNYDAARQANIEVRWPTPTAGQNVRVAQAGCLLRRRARTRLTLPLRVATSPSTWSRNRPTPSCGGPLQNGCVWSARDDRVVGHRADSMPRYGDDRVSIPRGRQRHRRPAHGDHYRARQDRDHPSELAGSGVGTDWSRPLRLGV